MKIKLEQLKEKAKEIRIEIIKMLAMAKSGHPAGALGLADIYSVLYFGGVMNYDPKNPDWDKRDRLILSCGHTCPALYASMALAGYFPVEELKTLRQINSRLQGHPSRHDLPGIETAAGSLGQGLAVAVGKALALKLNNSNSFVFCITSDGEHDEGSIWEAVMAANKFKLNNLINIIDRNYIQIDGNTEKVMPLGDLVEKYKTFGWEAMEIDGHDYQAINDAIVIAKKSDRPVCIVAKTIPGKCVSFMEGKSEWHGKAPSADEATSALACLES